MHVDSIKMRYEVAPGRGLHNLHFGLYLTSRRTAKAQIICVLGVHNLPGAQAVRERAVISPVNSVHK